MKKKQLELVLVSSLMALGLASCGNDTSSSSELPPIDLGEESLSYLKGEYFGKEGTLTLDKNCLTLTGKKELKLVPTSVDQIKTSFKSDMGLTSTLDVLAVYFSADYNDGSEYRAYCDLKNDGFLHLEKLGGGDYITLATFQPDISQFAGPLSYDGSSNIYNIYEVIDGTFDFDRDVYPYGRMGNGFWSEEQSWYSIARFRTSKKRIYKTIEMFDSDDYGYGEYELAIQDEKVVLLDNEGTANDYSDAGAFRTLSLFDGENSVSLSCDPDAKTIHFGGVSGTYETGVDEEGFFLKTTLEGKETIIRLHHRYVSIEVGSEKKVYPLDDVSGLVGEFTDKTDTYSFNEDDEGNYSLFWNGVKTNFDYVIANNRKALSFKVGENNYVAAPDKENSSIYLAKNGAENYFINANTYDSLFKDTFIAHDKKNSFSITITNDFSYTYGDEKGEAKYNYWHGDKFPSVNLDGGKNISIKQQDAGYFLLKDGENEITLYSKTVLDEVYGEYSSDGRDSLLLDETKITYNGIDYDYEFLPYYYENMGIYIFAINCDLDYFQSNLANCLYSDSFGFVKKSIFKEIAGTFSTYGTYGIENITMTEDGHLYLDTVNATNDGLDRDVAYEYMILTQAGAASKALLSFPYKGYSVLLYFYDGYVTIMGLNYYEQLTVLSWGTYVDSDMNHALFVQDDKIYYDGSLLSVTSKTKTQDTITMETDQGTLVLKKGDDNWTATLGDSSFTRKLSFEDYTKFIGEYSVNSTTLTIEKSATSYDIKLGTSSVSFGSVRFVIKDGKIAMKIPNAFDNYYLSLDLTTNVVTASYEGGSLPPLPPLPPSI